jgi:hypothetical protein
MTLWQEFRDEVAYFASREIYALPFSRLPAERKTLGKLRSKVPTLLSS